MKIVLLLLLAISSACLPCVAEDDPESQFYDGLNKVEALYRFQKAEILKKADRVVIYLVDFDGISAEDTFADEKKTISVAPYGKRTKILSSKEVEEDERDGLLAALCKQIAEPEHTGGAFCHFPIHGIRIYAGDEILHEGTFCWVCGNFSFSYPQGADWLDTNTELKGLFTRLMPLPPEELKRFQAKYPAAKR